LKNSAGHTPLALALLMDASDVASDLLRHGASVDILDHNGLTLLHSAIMDGNTKMALFLMNNGADVNQRYSGFDTIVI
jgi:ankyrin repeat protein